MLPKFAHCLTFVCPKYWCPNHNQWICKSKLIFMFIRIYKIRFNFLENRRTVSLGENCPYSEFSWSECGKIRTRKIPNTNTFHTVYYSKSFYTVLSVLGNLEEIWSYYVSGFSFENNYKLLKSVISETNRTINVFCYLQFLKNTKFVRILLDHF